MRLTIIASVLILTTLLFGCTRPPNDVQSILEGQGYSNIELTGYAFFACSDDDFFHDGFTATKDGKPVSGVVCSGFLKGSTIRLY